MNESTKPAPPPRGLIAGMISEVGRTVWKEPGGAPLPWRARLGTVVGSFRSCPEAVEFAVSDAPETR